MLEYSNTNPKYVDLEDGRTVLDLRDSPEKTDLFAYVMDRPQNRTVFEALVEAKDTAGLHRWTDSLNKNVLYNGLQKSYLVDVFRDCVFEKFPQEKVAYENLKRDINDTKLEKNHKDEVELNL